MKRKCDTYMARVYHGKAYTGVRMSGTANYVHKMKAECVIPENYVPQEVKRKIYEDMAIHNRDTIEYDIRRGILWVTWYTVYSMLLLFLRYSVINIAINTELHQKGGEYSMVYLLGFILIAVYLWDWANS